MNLSASISYVPIRSKRLTTVCASLCSFKRCSLLMLIPGTWKDRKLHIYKKRTHTYCIRLLLAVVSPISRTGTHAYVAVTYPVYVSGPT